MISYAHNFEDVLLSRLFRGQERGCWVDVGANHPWACSVSYHFYLRGWRGINIEPIPSLAALYATERPEDVTLNMGVSSAPGELTLWEGLGRANGLSTFTEAEVEVHRRAGFEFAPRRVAVTTLAQVCDQHIRGRTIDFMSIDVEGHEREVLRGADFTRHRPRVVLVEATRPNTQIPTHQEWEELLLGADYRFGLFDGVNRWYLRADEAQALLPQLATPVNVHDDYVPYELSALRDRVRVLEARLGVAEVSVDEIGEGALAVARRLAALHRRFPRLMSLAGRLIRR
jgi:FkbM family methyltransferase